MTDSRPGPEDTQQPGSLPPAPGLCPPGSAENERTTGSQLLLHSDVHHSPVTLLSETQELKVSAFVHRVCPAVSRRSMKDSDKTPPCTLPGLHRTQSYNLKRLASRNGRLKLCRHQRRSCKYQHSGSHCPVQQAGEPSRSLRAEGVAQEADQVARWGLVTPYAPLQDPGRRPCHVSPYAICESNIFPFLFLNHVSCPSTHLNRVKGTGFIFGKGLASANYTCCP